MLKGDPNEEIQFLGAVLIVALILGAIGFVVSDLDTTAKSYAAIQELYVPEEKPVGFCVKDEPNTIYFKNTVKYMDIRGDIQDVTDFCRNYEGNVLVEYGCKGEELVSIDIQCPYGCYNGACKSPRMPQYNRGLYR